MGDEIIPSVVQKNKETLLLDVTFRRIVEDTVNKISEEKFCKIFGSVCNNRKSLLIKLHKAFKDTVTKNALADLNALVEEENIGDALKRLANVVERSQADIGSDAWRPPGDVQEHLRTFDVQEKEKRKRKLEVWVASREADVAAKQQCLEQREAQLALLESRTLPRLEGVREETVRLRDCLKDSRQCLSACVSLATVYSLLPDSP